MEDEYKYKGVPITSRIVEEIILQIFKGQTLKRDDIVNSVLNYHIAKKGLKSEAQVFSRTVKKALSNLQNKQLASNISTGFWKIFSDDKSELNSQKTLVDESDNNTDEIEISVIPTHAIYGKGDNAIYLYYYPSYKLLAESKLNELWPCKIGRTDRDPLSRVLSQSSTALPEKPIIEFIIKSDDSSLLEKAIHSILHLKNRYLTDSPGTEWFMTNPNEVLNIIRYINETLL
jgi:hypothetical protein